MRLSQFSRFWLVLMLVTLILFGCSKITATPSIQSPLNAPLETSRTPDIASGAFDSSLPLPESGTPLETYIVFRSDRDEETNLYSMSPDGSDVQRLDFPETKGIRWIPELSAFVALLELEGKENLYLLNRQGKVIQRLTTTASKKNLPVYSNAAGHFAFPCVQSDVDICTVPVHGGEILNLTNYPSREASPAWSPLGDRILFISNRDAVPDVWVVNHDGTGLKNMTQTGQPHGSPSWSPDGKKILFTSQRDMNWEVYVMDDDGQNPVNLTNHPARDMTPQWSPDGGYIAFRSDRTGDDDLYVMKADGTEIVNVTNLPQSDEYVFVWAPDGKRLLFVSKADGDSDIYLVNLDGTERQNLTNNLHEDFAAQWVFSK